MPSPRGKRIAPATRDNLQAAALSYLERFAASAAQLRRVLQRRALRAARANGGDPAEAQAWIDAIVARLQRSGLLDDKRFAEGRAASLARRGTSRRHIAQALAQKGVAREHIEAGIAHAHEGHAGPREADLAAAAAYARRRRLGPYRPADERAGRRDKDLAALARAGFDFDVARRVIGALNIDDLEQTIARPDHD